MLDFVVANHPTRATFNTVVLTHAALNSDGEREREQ